MVSAYEGSGLGCKFGKVEMLLKDLLYVWIM
jgi:hypothetical protein